MFYTYYYYFIGGFRISNIQNFQLFQGRLDHVMYRVYQVHYKYLTSTYILHRRSWHGLTPPLLFFSNFLFTNLFSIKCLYFFIISSLFPYFNLFVSIFIQSYVNIKLQVSTLYIDTNNPRGEIIKK
jgi:hypothetical protein